MSGSPTARLPGRPAAWVLVVTWLAATGMLQWSVVRFKVPIVLVLTGAAVGLGVWLARRVEVRLGSFAAAVLLVGQSVLVLMVPLFSYLRGGARDLAVALLVGAGLVAAVLVTVSRRRSVALAAAVVVALTAYALATVVAVTRDPAPRIDVWVILQQAADGLTRGENMYASTWTGSPGVQDAFTYLPWMAVLTAPGRWLGGDVRWAIGFWFLVGAVATWLLGRRRRGEPVAAQAGYAVVILALVPGTLTQIDQAWTEPVLYAGIAGWALLVARDRPWLAVIPLAVVCASKQHLVLLLPLLALWRGFGWRRTVASAGLAGVLMLPWFLASPADFLHDTVTLLVGFHPIRFANTWYLLVLNETGVALPFAVTGVIVLAVLAGACWMVWRRQPPLGELLRWAALVLLVVNMVNKQAFYNQYWLCGALIMLSLAAERRDTGRSMTPSGRGGDHSDLGGQLQQPAQPVALQPGSASTRTLPAP